MNTTFLERVERALNGFGFSQELTFEAYPNMKNWGTQSAFSMYRNTDASVVDTKWGGKTVNGYSLYVSTVCRHNGTDENVNVDITVSKFEDSLGRKVEGPEGIKNKVRINMNCSDKVFAKRLATIIEAYEAIVEWNK